MAKRKEVIEQIHEKMGNYSAYDILEGKNPEYSTKEFISDLNKMRTVMKRRMTEYTNFNQAVANEVGIPPSETIVQQSRIRENQFEFLNKKIPDKPTITTSVNTLTGEQTEHKSWKLHLSYFNRLENVLSDGQDRNTSKLSGMGGIYEQQAKFLNMFLPDDQQIKINKKRLTGSTRKGIRNDIIQAYKRIQDGMKDKGNIRKLKDFWGEYNKFKERLSQFGINLEYEDDEQGRRLLKNFSKLFMKSDFNEEKMQQIINDAANNNMLNSIDDLGILVDSLKDVNNVIDTKEEQKRQDTEESTKAMTTSQTPTTADDFFKMFEGMSKDTQNEILRRMNQMFNNRRDDFLSSTSIDYGISALETKPFETTIDRTNEHVATGERIVKPVKPKKNRKKKTKETKGVVEGFKAPWDK